MRLKLSNDPSLSSLPLLSVFLKSYARPFLGIIPSLNAKGQIPEGVAASEISQKACSQYDFPELGKDNEKQELVEKDIRARFKKMCEGYFDNVAKKLVIEHKVQQQINSRIRIDVLVFSVFKNKIAKIMKHIFDPVRSLKIDNKRMRK